MTTEKFGAPRHRCSSIPLARSCGGTSKSTIVTGWMQVTLAGLLCAKSLQVARYGFRVFARKGQP